MRSFAQMRAAVQSAPPIRLVVAGGEAPEIAKAICTLLQDGLISSALVTGREKEMVDLFPAQLPRGLEFLLAEDDETCARLAIEAIREGRGNVLMKGHISSTPYLRAVVDRERGLRGNGVLSNATVAQMPSMDRLLVATDNGILPHPDLGQKRQIVLNTMPLFRGLGIFPVRVAAVCASEKVSGTLPATLDAQALARECASGLLEGFEIGGPMGYDVAVSNEAALSKGLAHMPGAGDANLLLFSNIDAANAVAKSWKYHGAAKTGSIVLGATVPVLLNSRSDSAERRVNALLLAAIVLKGEQS